MHHALEIQEILSKILHCCRRPDLSALARTCITFKEPALDALWEKLDNLSALARCLPEASHRSPLDNHCYSFRRPLTTVEWNSLRKYTRRIRSISIWLPSSGLDGESTQYLSIPSASQPLFSNLRHLFFQYTDEDRALLFLPLPSLISLDIQLLDLRLLEDSLTSFAKISSNLTTLSVSASPYAYVNMNGINPSFICQWQNLQAVDCPDTSLDMGTLLYLSRLSTLTRLSFKLSRNLPDQIASSDAPLSFIELHHLKLHSGSLDLVSQLLFRTQLPAIAEFHTFVEEHPFKQDVSAFLASARTSGIGQTVQKLSVQGYPAGRSHLEAPAPVLGLEDLQHCKAFGNLRHIEVNIEWKVDLTDSELLILASSWPLLEHFLVNRQWGWRSVQGITPNGLLQLLQLCPSLCCIALAMDTRGHAEVSSLPAGLRSTLQHVSYIDVLDSPIDAESVPTISAFFAGIAPRPECFLRAWWSWEMVGSPNREVYKRRWDDVCRRAKGISSSTQSDGMPVY